MSKPETPITLTHFILSHQQQFPGATGDFSILLHSIEIASKFVSSKVRQAGIFDLYGDEGVTNVQGETVKKLDVLANDAFITSLRRSQKVAGMVSEENELPIVVEGSAHYVAVFDPLDGSSNIDVNISIGTIFGIYKRDDPDKPVEISEFLQSGRHLVAAGYVMYGSATLLFFTTGQGVYGFTLDTAAGEYVLTHVDVKIKPKNTIYSVNEGNSKYWSEPTKRYFDSIKNPADPKVKAYSARYVGSMVADVHRTLLYGGMFAYPGDSNTPTGKLRLLYEANPMAMIIEQAGGKATTGTIDVLDLQPKHIHERCPIFLGSRECIEEVEKFFREYPEAK